ncbi:hypothetical protein [Eubacterium sp. An11]|uniref:hypothetical protein n=1 Tax=Eubacterium sp. An11 TaxID=1965542 RepID=UPI0026AFF434
MMKKNVWKGVFFLLPSMAGVSIFVLLPFLDVLRRAFTSAIGGQFVGISNFQSVLTNDAFRQAAGNSIRFTVICIPSAPAVLAGLKSLDSAHRKKRGIL